MPQTQPLPQEAQDEVLLAEYADLYQIMLYNDDYNTFDYVIELLMEVCEHTYEQAEQCEDLLPRCSRLTQAGLTAEILPR